MRRSERTPTELAREIEPYAQKLSDEERERLRFILVWDFLSEFDARFYSRYVRALDLPFTRSFLATEAQWALDEKRHCEVFRTAYDVVIGIDAEFQAELDRREANFGPIEHLFEDEFSIACLGAYDELATVRAYKANLEWYDRLGPKFGKVVRRVIADEAQHYANFLELLRNEHAHRVEDADRVITRIRETEGTPYANTFILDHDDPIFTDEIYDESESILRKHVGRIATMPTTQTA